MCGCVHVVVVVYGLFWSFVSPLILTHSLLGPRAPRPPPKTALEAVITPGPADAVPGAYPD